MGNRRKLKWKVELKLTCFKPKNKEEMELELINLLKGTFLEGRVDAK